MTRTLHVVSGIPPDSSGTGRLIRHLIDTRDAAGDWRVRFHYPERPVRGLRRMMREGKVVAALRGWLGVKLSIGAFRASVWWLSRFGRGELLVFHPQTLAFSRTLRLLRGWRRRAFIYGLDNSFFCVRSYNHVDGEHGACVRCLDQGFDAARRMGCRPFPVPDEGAFGFVRDLARLIEEGRVGVLVQNRRNADLYRQHLGEAAFVEVVGLWTADWKGLDPAKVGTAEAGSGYDVVFHGHFVSAKGADWLLEVARHLPDVRFMFPTPCPKRIADPPPNIAFRPMTWETGLAEEVARARLVCVPSLWSATIEGALVKSLAFGRATARADIPSGFGDELPPGLVLQLHRVPERGARQLREALETDWRPDPALRKRWLGQFTEENFDLFGRIVRAIERSRSGRAAAPSTAATSARPAIPEPERDHGLRLEKLGSAYGGWTVPTGLIDESWICYCVGVGEDASFDCALVERFGCRVYAFDPTPRAIAHMDELARRVRAGEEMPINNKPGTRYEIAPERLDRLVFAPFGVWSEESTQRFFVPKDDRHVSHSIVNLQKTDGYFEAECRTLAGLKKAYGHDRIDLLKLDVEGAEYEILRAMQRDGVRPRVLAVEFDEGNQPLDGDAPSRIAEWVDKVIDDGYALIARDGWNFVFVEKAGPDDTAGDANPSTPAPAPVLS
jgi:FkbM family methyltransferase